MTMLLWLSWSWGGPLIVGLVFGFIGGKAISEGTNAKLLAALVALVGSVSIYQESVRIAGLIMGVISIGYLIGVIVGGAVREDDDGSNPESF